jgi:hypothetical protein
MEALHPEALNGKRAGTVSFATRTAEGWKEWSVKASEAPQIAQDLIDHGEHVDLYFSHQRFRGWRDTERLLGLASLYCDVDFHSVDAWRGKDPRAVLVAILEALREARIPPPSYALDSGRGLRPRRTGTEARRRYGGCAGNLGEWEAARRPEGYMLAVHRRPLASGIAGRIGNARRCERAQGYSPFGFWRRSLGTGWGSFAQAEIEFGEKI